MESPQPLQSTAEMQGQSSIQAKNHSNKIVLWIILGVILLLGIVGVMALTNKPLVIDDGGQPVPSTTPIAEATLTVTPDLASPTPVDPAAMSKTISLEGDYCDGYNIFDVMCDRGTADPTECVGHVQSEKPYCNIINNDDQTTALELNINSDGGFESYFYDLGAKSPSGYYILEEIIGDDGAGGIGFHEYNVSNATLTKNVVSFNELFDQCLVIQYDRNTQMPLSIGENTELGEHCANTLTPEIQTKFNQFVTYF